MLAHLLIGFLVAHPGGVTRLAMRWPFQTMAACEAFLADPTPIVVAGGKVVGFQCVNQPSMPGTPT